MKHIDIIAENLSSKSPSVNGLLNDKDHSVQFKLKIHDPHTFWSLSLIASKTRHIEIWNFPYFSVEDYHNRTIINYLIEHFDNLIGRI